MSVEYSATQATPIPVRDGVMEFSSAFSPIHPAGYSMKKSPPPAPAPDFTVADTRPSMMHSSVSTFVPHAVSMNSYLPPEFAMYHSASQRDSLLSHKLLAYYPGFAHGGSAPYNSAEDEKPSQSYIGLIGKAILSSPHKKLVLSDIYNYILAHHSYFRDKGPGWRNSIRHNLSLNECFIKVGRSPNGKGHFWAINPANYEDFSKGEYRRKRAQRRNRKTAGESPQPCRSERKSAAKSEPSLKQEEQARARTADNNPCGVERLNQRETENRGFHIETLLSDSKPKRPSKKPAFTFVMPTTDPVSHFPTSSKWHGAVCGGETLVSAVPPRSLHK